MNAPTDHESPERSGRLRALVAALVAVEAALLLAAAVVLLVASARSGQKNAGELIALAAIAIAVGLGLALCARGVLGGLRWTRAPVLTWQLLQAAVGMPVSTTSSWWAGVPLLALAVVVGVLIAGRQVIPESAERF
jgi:hypothetical protein